jgi:thiamine biosynthesis lipoprotein
MRLDFGGIGKGIAADEMLRVLDSLGIRSALVDAGGDIVVSKAPPGEAGWCIQLPGVRDGSLSDKTITVSEAAVATSGDQFRWFEVDGVRYSHLIDPRDGIGVTVRRLVTVIAPTGSLADALASAISVDPDLAAWAWPETTVQVLEMDDRGWRQKRQERQERQ